VPTPTPAPTEAPAVQPAGGSSSGGSSSDTSQGSGSGNSNFNTYDNKEQQNTTATYVLNTNSKKIHHPSCSSVPKIAPKNYATSSESLDTLKAAGYTTCGNCFKK
ncbi:MAG: hypothetical protein NC121_20370, partial [Blautia sp.]|nr:hypothetical protein [Blautia sp.]